MLKPLLVEVGVEELPAIPLLKELPNIEKKWLQILEEYRFKTNFQFFYTPRRLTLWHREFPVKQAEKLEEFWGPPQGVAEKNPKAVEGFARKVGVTPDQLQWKEKKGGKFLYYSRRVEGESIKNLLGEMVEKWLNSLDFGKEMEWGSCKYRFIRPVRWILAMVEDEVIPFSTYCVTSGNRTRGHRIFKREIEVGFVGDYFCQLDKKGVILYPDQRRKRILEGIRQIEEKEGVQVAVNPSLLEEIVAITEYPTSLLGKFDEKFLQLPPEVIVTSMETHQRYFPVYKDGKLTNRFVVVSNAFTDNFSKIIAGNEKVLRARLEDALFFWQQDLKRGLDPTGLEKIVYMDGLGSLADKVEREKRIGEKIADKLGVEREPVEEAIKYGKADLLTEMVYEFPELQGIMGYYYGLKQGLNGEVATALKEQYGETASNPISLILNLAQKLDNILGLFSIGKIPKGNRDPFALRRSANHILKLLLDKGVALNLEEVVKEIAKEYKTPDGKEVDPAQVLEFIFERLYHLYKETNPAIIRAVLRGKNHSLPEIGEKIQLLHQLTQSEGWGELSSTFKRIANILKGVELSDQLEVDPSLLQEEAERRLWEEFQKVVERNREEPSLEVRLDNLLSLKPAIDRFFDEVRVNVEDPNLRRNRQHLIATIYREFLDTIGDIKEVG